MADHSGNSTVHTEARMEFASMVAVDGVDSVRCSPSNVSRRSLRGRARRSRQKPAWHLSGGLARAQPRQTLLVRASPASSTITSSPSDIPPCLSQTSRQTASSQLLATSRSITPIRDTLPVLTLRDDDFARPLTEAFAGQRPRPAGSPNHLSPPSATRNFALRHRASTEVIHRVAGVRVSECACCA